jgi:hypothetical protein
MTKLRKRHWTALWCSWLAVASVVAAPAVAEEGRVLDESQAPPRTWVGLRGGFGSAPIDGVGVRPTVCLEVNPLEMLGVEACGTGAGVLFEPGPEIAHFRSRLRLHSWQTDVGFLQPQLLLGFAELQVGDDTAGFHFFGPGPTGVETAGPEVGAALKWVSSLGAGFELLADASLSVAWFAHAPRLVVPMDPLQPSLLLNIGVGW